MPTLADLLPHAPAGAPESALAAAEARLGTPLPPDLRAFLAVSDGSPWTVFPKCGFQLLSLADTLSLWSLPESDRSGPQRLIDIGSDGSRERFCIDPEGPAIVLLEITDEEPPVTCAATVTELVEQLAAGWSPFP